MKPFVQLIVILLVSVFGQVALAQMLSVKGGEYVPLYGKVTETKVRVNSFMMDATPVTMADYAAFLEKYPQWRKSQIKRLFADQNYLKDWASDLDFGTMNPNRPVNNVSWFAAKAFCECQGKRLPTVDEWEYAAMASATKADARRDSMYNVSILGSYETPKTFLKEVGKTKPNIYGIMDLHGLVWEWAADFNSVMLSGNNRTGENNIQLFCAAGSYGATDLMNYAAFMRYALRSSVKANYSLTNMGFRCVKDIPSKLNDNRSL
jgi:formylglycine-generating enzyme